MNSPFSEFNFALDQMLDVIHFACALNHGIFTFVSDDKDFDRVREVKRKSLLEF